MACFAGSPSSRLRRQRNVCKSTPAAPWLIARIGKRHDVVGAVAVGGVAVELVHRTAREHEGAGHVAPVIGFLGGREVGVTDAILFGVDDGQLVPSEGIVRLQRDGVYQQAFGFLGLP